MKILAGHTVGCPKFQWKSYANIFSSWYSTNTSQLMRVEKPVIHAVIHPFSCLITASMDDQLGFHWLTNYQNL